MFFTSLVFVLKHQIEIVFIFHVDPENVEAIDLQRKLEMLNNIMDQGTRADQARRQMQYFGCEYVLYLINKYI